MSASAVQLLTKARAGFIEVQRMGPVERVTRGGKIAEAAISDALAAIDLTARAVQAMAGALVVDFADLRARLDALEKPRLTPAAGAVKDAIAAG